jgi:hypothetical protein
MSDSQARIAVATSFIVMSMLGAGLLFITWSSQDTTVAVSRSILFIVVIACIHLAGYLLYVQQGGRDAVESAISQEPSEASSQYWSALKHGIVLQLIVGVLAALSLDLGESLGFFTVAALGHWIGIFFIIIARRPHSPSKVDILFIRWGIVLLLIVTGLIAPFVWSLIGESHLSGWQRLSGQRI